MKKANANTDYCKECAICIDTCPKKAIEMTDAINVHGYKYIRIDSGKCIGCGLCYLVCPDAVFTIVEQ